MLFFPVWPLQPLRLIVPDMVTVKQLQALANQFPLFPWSTSLFHIGEQSLWKKCLTFGFMDHLRYGKKCHCVIPLTTRYWRKSQQPSEPLARTGLCKACVCVCVCIRYGYLYPQVQFELSCTINSHQADIVNLRDWRKDSSGIKRRPQNRWDALLYWQSPRPKTRLHHDDQSTVDSTREIASKSCLAEIQTSNYSASGKASPLPSLTLFEKFEQAKQEMCFHFQRQPRAKIERHFNELSQWGATCFIQIIGWLATLKWLLLSKQSLSFFLSFPSQIWTLSRVTIIDACRKHIVIEKTQQMTRKPKANNQQIILLLCAEISLACYCKPVQHHANSSAGEVGFFSSHHQT